MELLRKLQLLIFGLERLLLAKSVRKFVRKNEKSPINRGFSVVDRGIEPLCQD